MRAIKLMAIIAGAVGLAMVGAEIMDHVNWVGNGWCFHSSLVCYGLK